MESLKIQGTAVDVDGLRLQQIQRVYEEFAGYTIPPPVHIVHSYRRENNEFGLSLVPLKVSSSSPLACSLGINLPRV